jgi:hypothetical protein
MANRLHPMDVEPDEDALNLTAALTPDVKAVSVPLGSTTSKGHVDQLIDVINSLQT